MMVTERIQQPVEYLDAPDYPSSAETVHFDLRLEDALILRAAVQWQRDHGMRELMQTGEPGNALAKAHKQRLENNIGRYNDLLMAKF